jgi:hypothetical protein
VDLIPLAQQELSKVRAVLAGDSRNQGCFRHRSSEVYGLTQRPGFSDPFVLVAGHVVGDSPTRPARVAACTFFGPPAATDARQLDALELDFERPPPATCSAATGAHPVRWRFGSDNLSPMARPGFRDQPD